MIYSHLGHNRLINNLKNMYVNFPSSTVDEGSIALQKAEELGLLGDNPEDIEKGRPAMPIGAHASWGDTSYLKTASGWKPVGKKRGHVKANHDHIHENEEKDKDHLEMVHDAGKMSEEEWTAKHGSKLHTKYKEVHDYLHKEKKKKEAPKVETGEEKLAKLSDSEVKKLKEQSNAGFTHTDYSDKEITEEMKKRNILLDVKKEETKAEEKKPEPAKEESKPTPEAQEKDPNAAIGTISPDGKYKKTANGWEYIKEDKKPAEAEAKKEDPKPEAKTEEGGNYQIPTPAGHLSVKVIPNSKEGHFGVQVSNHIKNADGTEKIQRKDVVYQPNEKFDAFVADLEKRGGRKLGEKKEEVKPEKKEEATAKTENKDYEGKEDFMLTKEQYLQKLRDSNNYPVMDSLWERVRTGDHKKEIQDALEFHNYSKNGQRGSRSALRHAIEEGKISKEEAIKVIESAELEVPNDIKNKTETKPEEKPSPAEEKKEETGGKKVITEDADKKEALKGYFQSGVGAKEFVEKHEFKTGVNNDFDKKGKITDKAEDIFGYDAEVKVAEKPVTVKSVKDPADALKDIVSSDDLRPAMTGIYYTKGLAVATDAHKMVISKKDSEHNGKIIDPKTGKEIDARYPAYSQIIPDYGEAVKDVPVNDLIAKLSGIVNANKIFKDPEAQGVKARLKINDVNINVNAELALDALKALAKQGVSKVHISAGKDDRKAIVVTEDSGNHMALFMPLMNAADLPAKTVLEGTQNTYNSQFLKDVINQKDLRTNAPDPEAELKPFKEFLKTKGTTYERYLTMSGMPQIRLRNQFDQSRG